MDFAEFRKLAVEVVGERDWQKKIVKVLDISTQTLRKWRIDDDVRPWAGEFLMEIIEKGEYEEIN